MNKIKKCREANHMSQKYVAVSVGVSAPMVSQWESGVKKPSMENIVKLASLFGVTTDYLLDHDVPDQQPQNQLSDEQQLIMIFRQLNQTGRDLLLANAEAYLSQPALRQDVSVPSAI